MASTTTIAIIPGTGNMGSGLGWRFAKAGHRVLLGSRDAVKAQAAANKILAEFPNANIQAGKSEDLPLSSAEVIVWCPQGSIKGTIEYLKTFDFTGKIIIDTTNIVYKVKDEGTILGKTSSTEEKAYPSAKWVAGFKIVHFPQLTSEKPETPVQLFSDHKDALERVKSLVESTKFPIGKVGTLEEARENEVYLWNLMNQLLPAEQMQTMKNAYLN